jgi:hypothetical protein
MARRRTSEVGSDHKDWPTRKLAEDAAASGFGPRRVVVGGGGPLRVRHLAGVVGEISRDHRSPPLRVDQDAGMTGRVARARREPDLRTDPMVPLDEVGQAAIEDRPDAVGKDGQHVRSFRLRAPVLVLDPPEQVARAGEGRDPPAVDQHGVPADVIDVQVRAQHRIDGLARETGRGQVFEEPPLAIVPGGDAPILLVVAEAGVDDDPPSRRLDDERVDAHLEAAFGIGEVRDEPRDGQDGLARRLGQDEAAATRGFELHDFRHRYVADLPLHRRFQLRATAPAASISALAVPREARHPTRHGPAAIAAA